MPESPMMLALLELLCCAIDDEEKAEELNDLTESEYFQNLDEQDQLKTIGQWLVENL
jgi:hypothetical protein